MGFESTPGRTTLVRIDPSMPLAVQMPMAQERSCEEMARGASAATENLWLRPLSGWQISPYQRRPSNQQELASLQSAVWGANKLQTPTGWYQIPKFIPIQETGIDYGSGVTTSGDLFWDKQVKAGDDWSGEAYHLLADGNAFPGPLSAISNAPMDRIAVGQSSLAVDESFFIRFQLLGVRSTSPDYCLGVGFAAPAGLADGGIGEYYCAFGGDGHARIFELDGTHTWQPVADFAYCSRHQTVSMMHSIHFSPSTASLDPSLAGSLVIECTSTPQGLPSQGHFGRGAVPDTDSRILTLAIPISEAVYLPCPLRIDVRRDLRLQFQITSPVYPLSAILKDDLFSLPFLPQSNPPLILAWFSVPFGNEAISGTLYDGSTGSELASAGTIGDFPQFTPNPQSRYLQAEFQLSGDGSSTPTFFGYRVQTDGIAQPSTEVENDIQIETTFVNVISVPANGGFDRAIVRVMDATSEFLSLSNYAGHRLRIDVQTSETGSSLETNLFAGFVDEMESIIRGAVISDAFPAARFPEMEISALGAWSQLARAVSPIRFNYGLDFNSQDGSGKPQPYLVTEVLTSLFALAGFPDSMVNLPSSDIRLHSVSDTQGWILEPQASIANLINRIAMEFLGGVVLFDPNLGASGQWRLNIQGPGATINPIATFVTESVTGKIAHGLESYPYGTGFIRKGSLTKSVQPPAANMVVGYGLAGNFGRNGANLLLKQSYVNVMSFPFLGSSATDPTSVDYLGSCRPLFTFLPQCSTGEALSFSLRRVYDENCHGKRFISFQSPLILVTDANDIFNTGPRFIRANDIISYENASYRLTSVDAEYKRDAHQYAHYEAALI